MVIPHRLEVLENERPDASPCRVPVGIEDDYVFLSEDGRSRLDSASLSEGTILVETIAVR